MNHSHNITKNIVQLQEESKKKNPEVYRECEESLAKIRQIDAIISLHSNELPESNKQDQKDGRDIKQLTEEEMQAYEKSKLPIQIRPFIKAISAKKSVPIYIYDTINSLLCRMVLEDSLVLELTDSLVMQLNINGEHAIKIFQSFYFVIQYKCVKGDTIMNLFYSLINILGASKMIVVSNAKAMSKQIIFTIFSRFRDAYKVHESNGDNEKEFTDTKADCKTILNDICEFIGIKNDFKFNVELSLEFIEIIFKIEEIFYASEIKEIFLRLVNQIDKIEEVQSNDKLKEKHNMIILSVVKNNLFTDDSHLFIEKSADNLHIFDSGTIRVIFENEQKREIFFAAALKNLQDKNICFEWRLKLICNVFEFLKIIETDSENKKNEEKNKHFDILEYTMEIFISFLSNTTFNGEGEDKIIEILGYLILNSIENKTRLYWLIKTMFDFGGNCCIECTKICFNIRENIRDEWKIIFDHIEEKSDLNCFNFILQKLTEFKADDLFYLLAFVRNPEHMRLVFKNGIDIITKDSTCFVSVLFLLYHETSIFCSVVDEYNLYITEHDLESELIPFLFINSAFKNHYIKDIMSKHSSLNIFKSYNDKVQLLKNRPEFSNTTATFSESDIHKLLFTLHDSIRIIGNSINSSWITIFDTLTITTSLQAHSGYNFKILQLISEELYALLPDECQLKMPKLFYQISEHEIANISILLQILNLLSDNSKFMSKQILSYKLWRIYLESILAIILKNKIGWNDVFDTGIVILFNILNNHKFINNIENELVEETIYDYVLTEILIVLKDTFYTKIALNKEIPHEEKQRFKDTFILGLEKVNSFLSNYGVTNHKNKFIYEYFKFITDVICFKHDTDERGVEQWKDSIATECLKIFKIKNQKLDDSYLTVLEKMPILKNDESAEDQNITENCLYYKKNIYLEFFEFTISAEIQTNFIQKIDRFFIVKNFSIRDKIFNIITSNINMNNFLHYSTRWLKTDDLDILSRLFVILKEYFKDCDDKNKSQNIIEPEINLDNNIRPRNKRKLHNSDNINMVSTTDSKKITFIDDKGLDSNNLNASIIRDLMKNLTVLMGNDLFWEEVISIIQIIALKIRNNFEVVKYFMEFSIYIFNVETDAKERYKDVITLYGGLDINKKPNMSLLERKKEKILMNFMDVYMNVISIHFINDADKDSKHINSTFVETAFSIIYDLSFIQSGKYRENLSAKCMKILFMHSRFTKELLLKRIKKGLKDYVNEINVFRDVYSRVKKNEIYLMLDCIIENPGLVKELKDEIVDALSSKDFNTIEKIRLCLKKGL